MDMNTNTSSLHGVLLRGDDLNGDYLHDIDLHAIDYETAHIHIRNAINASTPQRATPNAPAYPPCAPPSAASGDDEGR